MPSDDLQAALAQVVSETSAGALPAKAIDAAEVVLLDSLAIGIAGADNVFSDSLLSIVRTWGAGGNCRVLGCDASMPAQSAAFMNAYQMHCLEFDAVHEAAVAHVATAPIAALLTELDACDTAISGERFLTALVVGVEVAATLGLAADAPLTFFRPATTGVFGAAAAVAALRGFDLDTTHKAFAYALASASGTMQAHEEGMPTLPIQLASAARAGLMAADLAQTNMPTARQAITGKFGYLALFESKVSTRGLAARVGGTSPWRISEMALKPYPSGRATHGGVEAVRRLRTGGLGAENFASAELIAPPLIDRLVNRPAHEDMNANYARLCFPYVAACMLRRGRVKIEDFSPDALRDADTLSIASKIRVRTSKVDDPAAFTPQDMVALDRDGRRHEATIEHLLGAPEHPMTATERRTKIEDCTGSRDQAENLMSACDGLWRCSDVRERFRDRL